jgi:hypothetical protein
MVPSWFLYTSYILQQLKDAVQQYSVWICPTFNQYFYICGTKSCIYSWHKTMAYQCEAWRTEEELRLWTCSSETGRLWQTDTSNIRQTITSLFSTQWRRQKYSNCCTVTRKDMWSLVKFQFRETLSSTLIILWHLYCNLALFISKVSHQPRPYHDVAVKRPSLATYFYPKKVRKWDGKYAYACRPTLKNVTSVIIWRR